MPLIPLAEVLPAALPDWIPPSVMVIVGLALAAGWANQRGWWVSGREHKSMVDAKDEEIARLTAVATARLDYAEARRKEEREARAEDARIIGLLTGAATNASATMERVERDLNGSDLYSQRQQSAPGRRPKAAPGSRPDDGDPHR